MSIPHPAAARPARRGLSHGDIAAVLDPRPPREFLLSRLDAAVAWTNATNAADRAQKRAAAAIASAPRQKAGANAAVRP